MAGKNVFVLLDRNFVGLTVAFTVKHDLGGDVK
jgi:hypothetical protein